MRSGEQLNYSEERLGTSVVLLFENGLLTMVKRGGKCEKVEHTYRWTMEH